MISRDYLSVKVWDLHMETKPIETYTVRVFGILSARNLFLSTSWAFGFVQTRKVFNSWLFCCIKVLPDSQGWKYEDFSIPQILRERFHTQRRYVYFRVFKLSLMNFDTTGSQCSRSTKKKKNMTIFPSIFQHEEKYEIITWIFIFFISGS